MGILFLDECLVESVLLVTAAAAALVSAMPDAPSLRLRLRPLSLLLQAAVHGASGAIAPLSDIPYLGNRIEKRREK
jgi:hypothetical protein